MLMKQINSDTNGKIYHVLVRESVPRQVDRESRGPQGERGLEFSRRKKGQSLDSTFCYLKMLIMGVDLVFTRMYLA